MSVRGTCRDANAQDVEEIGRHPSRAGDRWREIAGGEVDRAFLHPGDAGQRLRSPPKVVQVQVGQAAGRAEAD